MEAIDNPLLTNPLSAVVVEQERLLWIGLGSWGFFVHDRATGSYTHNLDLPEFRKLGRLPTINTIVQSPTSDKVWLGTYDWGVVSYDRTLPAGEQAQLLDYARPLGCLTSAYILFVKTGNGIPGSVPATAYASLWQTARVSGSIP